MMLILPVILSWWFWWSHLLAWVPWMASVAMLRKYKWKPISPIEALKVRPFASVPLSDQALRWLDENAFAYTNRDVIQSKLAPFSR